MLLETAAAGFLMLLCLPGHRLADLMEQHQEELATIEAIDSGAVYTLALKTHVGMSIQTFRYFAGWCDKIQVRRIALTRNVFSCTAKKQKHMNKYYDFIL